MAIMVALTYINNLKGQKKNESVIIPIISWPFKDM